MLRYAEKLSGAPSTLQRMDVDELRRISANIWIVMFRASQPGEGRLYSLESIGSSGDDCGVKSDNWEIPDESGMM